MVASVSITRPGSPKSLSASDCTGSWLKDSPRTEFGRQELDTKPSICRQTESIPCWTALKLLNLIKPWKNATSHDTFSITELARNVGPFDRCICACITYSLHTDCCVCLSAFLLTPSRTSLLKTKLRNPPHLPGTSLIFQAKLLSENCSLLGTDNVRVQIS